MTSSHPIPAFLSLPFQVSEVVHKMEKLVSNSCCLFLVTISIVIINENRGEFKPCRLEFAFYHFSSISRTGSTKVCPLELLKSSGYITCGHLCSKLLKKSTKQTGPVVH